MISNSMDKEAQILAGENQLKLFSQFLQDHDSRISKLLNDVDDRHMERNYQDKNNINKLASNCFQPVNASFNYLESESITVFQIIDSDNKLLNKILATFAQLCYETNHIHLDSVKCQRKFLYLDEDILNSKTLEEASGKIDHTKISDSLEFLLYIKCLIRHCSRIGHSILQQLDAFYSIPGHINATKIRVDPMLDALCTIIVQLITFDEILSVSNFHKFWPSFKITINYFCKSQANSGNRSHYTDIQIAGLFGMVNDIESIFMANLFQNFLDDGFKFRKSTQAKSLDIMSKHLQDYIRKILDTIGRFSNDLSDFNETESLIRLNAICVFYYNYCGQLDNTLFTQKKLFKTILDYNLKHNGITLIGNVVWCPEKFLHKYAQTLIKGYEKQVFEIGKKRNQLLQTKIKGLLKDTRRYCIQISLWSLQMNSLLQINSYDLNLEQFRQRCTIFLQGLQYAGQLSHMIKSIANLHVLLHMAIHKTTLMTVCKLIEYLKIIHVTFETHTNSIAKTIQCNLQYLQYRILSIIAITKKKCFNEPYNERNLDIISALQIVERCMYGPSTYLRFLITKLAISVSNQNRTSILSNESIEKLQKIIQKSEILSNLQENLFKICDTTFLYWNQIVLPVYLKQVTEKHMDSNKLNYIVTSLNDCIKHFDGLNLSNNMELIELFKNNNIELLKSIVIEKECTQMETLLRLKVHANLRQTPNKNNLRHYKKVALYDCRIILSNHPIQLNGRYMVLKDYVENYLSDMFYNLTTIALHNWKTYGEMRSLANYRFNLNTISDYLPTQTLDQGIDVLEIMRNIHIFVSKYLYNMHNQMFIESSSNNKHLNTIGIRHIANSLRTHGTGIINTTVNFTYQFLRIKFRTLSDFLYDEHIKSHLIKDFKSFRDNRDKQNQMYNYDRANSFNRGIRKLGLTPKGQSCLDLFRETITQIGNAMGYIRLIRSGRIHANFNGSIYLPKFDDDSAKFTEYTSSCDSVDADASNSLPFAKETQLSATVLDDCIRDLTKNSFEGPNYFRLLVDAFAPSLQNSKNIHLRNFYLIIPPLMINYVEHMLYNKDKLTKHDKQGAIFVDDGFIMGLTYILNVLNQMDDFNSLHWFKSINQKFNDEYQNVIRQRQLNEEQKRKNDYDLKLEQTLILSEQRIKAHKTEFNLLIFNISSAKNFFQ